MSSPLLSGAAEHMQRIRETGPYHTHQGGHDQELVIIGLWIWLESVGSRQIFNKWLPSDFSVMNLFFPVLVFDKISMPMMLVKKCQIYRRGLQFNRFESARGQELLPDF